MSANGRRACDCWQTLYIFYIKIRTKEALEVVNFKVNLENRILFRIFFYCSIIGRSSTYYDIVYLDQGNECSFDPYFDQTYVYLYSVH